MTRRSPLEGPTLCRIKSADPGCRKPTEVAPSGGERQGTWTDADSEDDVEHWRPDVRGFDLESHEEFDSVVDALET